MFSEAKLMRFGELPDQQLFGLLKSGDNDAWEYVFLKVVLPVTRYGSTKNGIPYRNILKDKFVEEGDVYSELYTIMMGKNKLDKYAFRCPLIYWMRWYVRGIILKYCKEISSHVSDECLKFLSINSETAEREAVEVKELSFSELWRENPMKAYVYLLKSQKCYSSVEIRDFLGMSTAANVDQNHLRAKKIMDQLERKYSGEER